MLKVENFEVTKDKRLHYRGVNSYFIADDKGNYLLDVYYNHGNHRKFACSGMNTVMETIELLENGWEI